MNISKNAHLCRKSSVILYRSTYFVREKYMNVLLSLPRGENLYSIINAGLKGVAFRALP